MSFFVAYVVYMDFFTPQECFCVSSVLLTLLIDCIIVGDCFVTYVARVPIVCDYIHQVMLRVVIYFCALVPVVIHSVLYEVYLLVLSQKIQAWFFGLIYKRVAVVIQCYESTVQLIHEHFGQLSRRVFVELELEHQTSVKTSLSEKHCMVRPSHLVLSYHFVTLAL